MSDKCQICGNIVKDIDGHLLHKHCISASSLDNTDNQQTIDENIRELGTTGKLYKRKDGLLYIKIPIIKTRRLLHEVIIERTINRGLYEWEVAYHKDFDISNNTTSNIGILPFAELPRAPRRAYAERIHSGKKGKRKEREVAKLLGEWWGDGEFKPTPQSGGWDRTGKFQMKGDIITNVEFPFCVEIKNRESWSWSKSINSVKSPLHGFWDEVVADAKSCNLEPILLFTRNNHPLFVAMRISVANKLECQMFGFHLKKGRIDCWITIFEELIKNSPQSIKNILCAVGKDEAKKSSVQ